MRNAAKSVRAFLGARNFEESRQFYKELGFIETPLSTEMSLITINENIAFYLQNAYVKDWVDNTMMFLEVEDVDSYWAELEKLGLHFKYKNVRLSAIRIEPWGKECFLHDPSGILWHFGEFK